MRTETTEVKAFITFLRAYSHFKSKHIARIDETLTRF
jgi:hypothetical protein